MHQIRKGILAALLTALPALALSQDIPVSDRLNVTAKNAWTWSDTPANILQLDGPVDLQLDRVTMHADAAVLWISPGSEANDELQQVEIALMGNASLTHAGAKRSGDRLFVTALVRSDVRVSAGQRLTRRLADSRTYQTAIEMRDASGFSIRAPQPGRWRPPRPSAMVEKPPAPRGSTLRTEPVETQIRLQFKSAYTHRLPDNTIAVVIDKGLLLTIHRYPNSVTQLKAERGVVFTHLTQFANTDALQRIADAPDAIESAYLEGDVQITFSPKSESRPEARLEANQAFYEIATDRAVLTDAVVHTMDPASRVPIVMRAQTIKQLSREDTETEFRLQDSRLTTSSFATPTYAIAAEKAYVRQSDAVDDYFGTRTTFSGSNTSLTLWGVPTIWLPYAGGTITERGFPLRAFDVGGNDKYGFFTRTQWGLFESIGRQPPRNLDVTYSADYLSERGPAGGIDAKYHGDSINDNTAEPTSFLGDFKSYFVYDNGVDKLGANRQEVTPPDEFRGRVRWEHQQFLPDDWQAQFTAGWISDATFLEEFFPNEFHNIEPQQDSVYIKHQRDSEALTLLVAAQPANFVTTQDLAQEAFEVSRMPELGYHRIGDSFSEDSLTLYSDNSVSHLSFDDPKNPMQQPIGLGPYSPGYASLGWSGTTNDAVNRGDLRQEIDYPITVARYRVTPYVMARYTGYDNSPSGTTQQRYLAGTGMRVSTAFWQNNDDVESETFDVHRMRHVIEPELTVFSSVNDTQQQDVFVFDEPVDSVSNVGLVQMALHQRWQTQRGAPGHRQSVDLVTLNTESNYFFNKVDEPTWNVPAGAPDPHMFRGLYYPSLPEASTTRNGVNSDLVWRITDSTASVNDVQYNSEGGGVATAATGLAVRRGDRITWYLGERYINELDSSITSFLMNYEVSTKYSLGLGQSFDWGDGENVNSSISVTRRFDGFNLSVTVASNERTGDSGLYFSIRPSYLPSAMNSQQLPGIFGTQH